MWSRALEAARTVLRQRTEWNFSIDLLLIFNLVTSNIVNTIHICSVNTSYAALVLCCKESEVEYLEKGTEYSFSTIVKTYEERVLANVRCTLGVPRSTDNITTVVAFSFSSTQRPSRVRCERKACSGNKNHTMHIKRNEMLKRENHSFQGSEPTRIRKKSSKVVGERERSYLHL